MEPYEFIENNERVITQFGRWPSFHDGEVHRIVLNRMSQTASGRYMPTLELHLRGWILTSELTEDGLCKQADSVVQFMFEDIFDLELEGFNQQNVLSSLNLTLLPEPQRNGPALHVELEHCYLFSGEFSARQARILDVIPYVRQLGA